MTRHTLRRARPLQTAFVCLLCLSSCQRVVATFTQEAAAWLNNAGFDSRSASLADIDKDGDLDLFFQGSGSDQKLFLNNVIGPSPSHSFTNVSTTMLPSPTGLSASWSAAWGDYDGDGRIDVFVGQSNTAAGAARDLLRNNGAGFSNVSQTTNLNDPEFHQNVAWSDLDNDQDLDLIIGMEGILQPNGTYTGKHQIYLQDSPAHFTPVGATVGIQSGP